MNNQEVPSYLFSTLVFQIFLTVLNSWLPRWMTLSGKVQSGKWKHSKDFKQKEFNIESGSQGDGGARKPHRVGEITRGWPIWQKPWPPPAAGTTGGGNMTGARITCSPSRRCVLREDAAPGRESTIPWFLTFFHPLLSSQWPHIRRGQSSADKRVLETQPAFQRTTGHIWGQTGQTQAQWPYLLLLHLHLRLPGLKTSAFSHFSFLLSSHRKRDILRFFCES